MIDRLEVGTVRPRRPKARPRGRFIDVVRENTKSFGMKEDDGVRWRLMIGCGHP